MKLQDRVHKEFERLYASSPSFFVRAPGRVNLIGEHTDYNDGFVLPMAIHQALWLGIKSRKDRRVTVHSLDYRETASFTLDDLRNLKTGWIEYVKGVAWVLQESGMLLRGWDGVLAGDLPIGAGLSSSAALELASARAFTTVSDLPWEASRMARLAQKAERQWVGVNCGIMDQMISACGIEGHALLIDCRSLDIEVIPLPSKTAVVIIDSLTRRGLRDSAYNERREQCEVAANFFDVPALRDLSLSDYDVRADQLDGITRRRARHVITENARTLQAAKAMHQNDAAEMGRLMNASHLSLRDDFEVSNAALDTIAANAQQLDVCFGARMTGAGFGGCVVALVRDDSTQAFSEIIRKAYQEETGRTAEFIVSSASRGVEVL
jgi:galactokinase